MAEDLNHFRLSGRIIFERSADGFPGFINRARSIEQTDETVRRVRETMILVAGGIADDVPAFIAIELPRDLGTRPQPGLQVLHAIPGLGKCGAKLESHR